MRTRLAAAGIAGLVLGLGAGLLLRGRDGATAPAREPSGSDVAAAPSALAALRDELARERAARAALEAKVDELRDAVLEWSALPSEDLPGDDSASEGGDEAVAAQGAAGSGETPWFDAGVLLETGLPAREVERLRERFAEHELAELYLRDQASREGWLNKSTYRQTLREMREAFRAELGEEDYDRMLYAAGRQNRVRVVDVLPDSPADRAGLRAGDVLLSYAGERMFEIRTLTQVTRGGHPGDPTEIRYIRDGEEGRVYVPRGPLGVRLGPGRLPPAP